MVDTQSEAPINDCKKGSKAKYCLLDCDPLLKEAGAPLHKHTKTWITFWKWALTNNLVEAPLVWDINKPVTHVGYSLRGCGFTIRPRLTHNEMTLAWLWTYFHPSSGRRRNLSAPLRPWYRHTGNMWCIRTYVLATCVSAHIRSLHVVVLPVYVVVFSSRYGWWKAPPVSPATSSKVQKCHCYWVCSRISLGHVIAYSDSRTPGSARH